MGVLPGRNYECYSDEHYMPVLLAYAGKQEETDCTGLIMNVDWEEGGPHPISYHPDNVTEAVLRQLRKPDDCDSAAALRCANGIPVNYHDVCAGACSVPCMHARRDCGSVLIGGPPWSWWRLEYFGFRPLWTQDRG
jgi:hypothetical protein